MNKNNIWRNLIFLGFQFTPLLALFSGISWSAFIVFLGSYFMLMFGVTAGYHRYFSHRTFETSRVMQFLFALLGTLTLQKGVLHWSANHRDHHRYSDKPEDLHSPVQKGFWWSHMGWIMADDYVETRWHRIKDFSKFPELVWLNTYWSLPFITLCILVFFMAGFQYLVWACFIPVVCVWHATFGINSIAHMWGKRVYNTTDSSRNNFWFAIPTLGEGWHNNHHYYSASVRQGFHWWQIDLAYYVLCIMEALGLVWNLHRPSAQVVAGELRAGESCLVED